MEQKGLLHLYYGDGKGKTTAAMGLALRALGSGRPGSDRSIFEGWFQRRGAGAGKAGRSILPGSTGRKICVPDERRRAHRCRAQQNANLTAALAQPADLLVLDEAGSAWELDMVDKELLRRAVLQRPAGQECVLTAHTPPQWMQDAADYVTEMHCVRHPYQKGIAARQGIEY